MDDSESGQHLEGVGESEFLVIVPHVYHPVLKLLHRPHLTRAVELVLHQDGWLTHESPSLCGGGVVVGLVWLYWWCGCDGGGVVKSNDGRMRG